MLSARWPAERADLILREKRDGVPKQKTKANSHNEIASDELRQERRLRLKRLENMRFLEKILC